MSLICYDTSQGGQYMKKINVKTLVIASFSIAIIFVFTAFITIPIGQFGYVNVGDSGIMVFASLLGAPLAFIVSGLGSAMADLYLGFTQYALFTFLIKGLEGFVIALLLSKLKGKLQPIAYLCGVVIMVVGYYLSDAFLLQSAYAALGGIAFNVVQGITSVVIATVLSTLLFHYLQKNIEKKA